MKHTFYIFFLSLLFILNSCISQFVPEIQEDKELVVVEGIISDQPVAYTIKLSKSLPLGLKKNIPKPMKGCIVSISDDQGKSFNVKETVAGMYITDPTKFIGVIGRSYTLHINTGTTGGNHNYESLPLEMKKVPPIDSIYYEKVAIGNNEIYTKASEGAQIYLNTHDPTNNCKFYRWEFSETWEFHLPNDYTVPNNICWISANSGLINVKNTSVLGESRIIKYPLTFISSSTDRLAWKYSILVNQYSLNEVEYTYWEKLQTMSEQVGGLYDITPSSIPSNIRSIDDPTEVVLGFFSVSAVSSKRIFIQDHFLGLIDLYANCIDDTIYGTRPIPNLNVTTWVIIDSPSPPPPFRVTTYTHGCADCTVRGTKIKPLFWK
jgi:hypothetical protein